MSVACMNGPIISSPRYTLWNWVEGYVHCVIISLLSARGEEDFLLSVENNISLLIPLRDLNLWHYVIISSKNNGHSFDLFRVRWKELSFCPHKRRCWYVNNNRNILLLYFIQDVITTLLRRRINVHTKFYCCLLALDLFTLYLDKNSTPFYACFLLKTLHYIIIL